MAGEYLPPVITRLTADISDFLAKIEAAKAAIKSLGGTSIPITADVDQASFARARAALASLGRTHIDTSVGVDNADDALRQLYVDTGKVVSVVDAATKASWLNRAAVDAMTAGINSADNASRKLYADEDGTIHAVTAASRVMALSGRDLKQLNTTLGETPGYADRAAAGLAAIGKAAGGGQGPVLAWLSTWKTVIHWVIAGSAELLAVGIPALIAMGAYALVAAQGFQNMYVHMSALYTVQEATANMFHRTAGDALGLGHAIQSAQDAINIQTYQLLGAAINGAKNHLADFAKMGTTMSGVIDTFAAKVNIELKGALGTQLTGLLQGATTYATQFGQVFGNIGHTILNIASDMPGIAGVLLHTLSLITGAFNALTTMSWSKPIVLGTMALEEFARWGGVATGALTRLFRVQDLVNASGATGFISRFGAGIAALIQGAGNGMTRLGQFVGRLAGVSQVAGSAGTGLAKLGGRLTILGAELSPLQGALIALAVAGVGFLIYKLLSARSAAQQFADALQKSVQAATNYQAVSVLGDNLAKLGQRLNQVKTGTEQMGKAQIEANAAGTKYGAVVMQSRQATATYNSAIQQTRAQLTGVSHNAAAIMKQFGVDYPTALALAQGANVKIATSTVRFGKALTVAGQQMLNYIQGMKAMGASSDAFGADLKAVAIQTGLANTKVASLNQAMDAFMQTVTGGTTGFSQFVTALQGMGKDVSATSASLSGAISSIRRNAGGMAYTLKGTSAAAMQSWQQFNQALSGSAQQLSDWFRTAGAMGVMTKNQFGSAIKDMVAQLLPYTQGNKTAVRELSAFAQQAGGPATSSLKQLAGWVGHTGNAGKQLQKIIDAVTGKMSNMSTVAQNLGSVLSSQTDQAISASIMKTSGLSGAIQKYTTDLVNLGPHNRATITAYHEMQAAEARATTAAQRASQATKNFGSSAQATAGKVHYAASTVDAYIGALGRIPTHLSTAISLVYTTVGAAANSNPLLHPKPHAAGTLSAQPGWAMVGEQGPELVNLGGGGQRIYSNSQSKGMMGGGGDVVIHVDGRELFRFAKDQVFANNVNNGNRGGNGSVRGTLVPR